MTRIKPKILDKIRDAFEGVDKILVDRTDAYDQSKIQQLEEKMNEVDGFNDFNKNNFGHINKITNKKMNLKNSKQF